MSAFRESIRYIGYNVTSMSGRQVKLLFSPKPAGLFSCL
ncbi:unnamed protein product [Gulo gulo]|uniref:Uncharacterized protein n=1 Tax=Gulo gulo TaxID=48420 RepID=A0A9X9QAQ9_GULGU|nr:unnamed protein product [Gulo gulo]